MAGRSWRGAGGGVLVAGRAWRGGDGGVVVAGCWWRGGGGGVVVAGWWWRGGDGGVLVAGRSWRGGGGGCGIKEPGAKSHLTELEERPRLWETTLLQQVNISLDVHYPLG